MNIALLQHTKMTDDAIKFVFTFIYSELGEWGIFSRSFYFLKYNKQ